MAVAIWPYKLFIFNWVLRVRLWILSFEFLWFLRILKGWINKSESPLCVCCWQATLEIVCFEMERFTKRHSRGWKPFGFIILNISFIFIYSIHFKLVEPFFNRGLDFWRLVLYCIFFYYYYLFSVFYFRLFGSSNIKLTSQLNFQDVFLILCFSCK